MNNEVVLPTSIPSWLLMCCIAASSLQAAAIDNKPNIIVIFTDDKY